MPLTVAALGAVSVAVALLLFLSIPGGPDFKDPEEVWIILLLSPYLSAGLLPLFAMMLLPRRGGLRPQLAELRLTGLTIGQIAVGHLHRAGWAMLWFQAIWLVGLIGLGSVREVFNGLIQEFFRAGSWDDTAILWAILLGAVINPWLMLGLGWFALVRWGGLLAVAGVTITVSLLLNPISLIFALFAAGLDFSPDEGAAAILELLCAGVRISVVALALRWLHRNFDRIVAEDL